MASIKRLKTLVNHLLHNGNIADATTAIRKMEAVEAAVREAVVAQEATFADDSIVESSLTADATASPSTAFKEAVEAAKKEATLAVDDDIGGTVAADSIVGGAFSADATAS